jgi:hypothetical protein
MMKKFEADIQKLEGIKAALRRAAIQARHTAQQTHTACIIKRNGKLVDVSQELPASPSPLN